MRELTSTKPDYGNWVSHKLLYIPGGAAAVCAALSLLSPWFVIPATLFFVCFAYFAYARARFSPRQGDIQARVQALLLDHLDWDGQGQALDIGCGSGALTTRLAAKYPHARVTGVDYWGEAWEYSQEVSEHNARLEGVGDRVTFRQATAAALPFDDQTFDAVASNLTFHEVRDARDKRLLIKEALRVVRPGGSFAFQDLFLWKQVYGEIDDLLAAIRSWGVESVEFIDTSSSSFIPRALKLPFMLGTIGVLHGTK